MKHHAKGYRTFSVARAAALVIPTLFTGYALGEAANFSEIKQSLQSYLEEYQRLNDGWQYYSDADDVTMRNGSDKEIIQRHYNDLRMQFLVNDFKGQDSPVLTSVNKYISNVDTATNDFFKQINVTPAVRSTIEKCVRERTKYADLSGAAKPIEEAYASTSARLNTPFGQRRRSGTPPMGASFDEAINALNVDWGNQYYKCCSSSGVDNDACVTARNANFKDLTKDAIPEQLKQASSVPNPADRGIKPAQLAAMIQAGELNRSLKGGPGHNSEDMERNYDRALDKASYTCNRARDLLPADHNPMLSSLTQTLGKTLKCAVLPFIGVQSMDTPYQRMTTAVGAMPIEGNHWNLNCDPREMAMWNAMRPTDPNVIAQQWGINQNMANPPWIGMLRSLPPVQSPFPVVSMPGGGVVTPMGLIGNMTPPSSTASATAGTNGSTTVGAGGGRGALIASTKTQSVSVKLAASRGVAAGSGATRGIRRVASNIARGQSVAENVGILATGAASTRALAQTMVKNNSALSAPKRRGANAASASTAMSAVRNLVGAAASRASAQGISNQMSKLRSGRAQAAATKQTGTALADIEAQNEIKRKRLELLARTYADNIDFARKQAEALRQQIFGLISDRDSKVVNLVSEIMDKPPKTQAKMVNQRRKEMMDVDKQLGQLKAQYDIYIGNMLEQSSLLRNVVAFGGTSIGPGNTWNAATLSTTSALVGSPQTIGGGVSPFGPPPPTLNIPGAATLQAQPTFPTATNPSAVRSSQLEDFFWNLNILPKAYAATQNKLGIYHNEQEWADGLDRFIDDIEAYSSKKMDYEKSLGRVAAQLHEARDSSINLNTATDGDTDMLTAMDMYSSSMSDEVEDLLQSSTQGKISLGSDALTALRKVKLDSQLTQEALESLALQYKDAYPKSVDENPEVWWAMLPEMLIY